VGDVCPARLATMRTRFKENKWPAWPWLVDGAATGCFLLPTVEQKRSRIIPVAYNPILTHPEFVRTSRYRYNLCTGTLVVSSFVRPGTGTTCARVHWYCSSPHSVPSPDVGGWSIHPHRHFPSSRPCRTIRRPRLSLTGQQYFSEEPATRQQYSSLRRNQHQPSATSQPNRLRIYRVSVRAPCYAWSWRAVALRQSNTTPCIAVPVSSLSFQYSPCGQRTQGGLPGVPGP
jgi:hypothetical protein